MWSSIVPAENIIKITNQIAMHHDVRLHGRMFSHHLVKSICKNFSIYMCFRNEVYKCEISVIWVVFRVKYSTIRRSWQSRKLAEVYGEGDLTVLNHKLNLRGLAVLWTDNMVLLERGRVFYLLTCTRITIKRSNVVIGKWYRAIRVSPTDRAPETVLIGAWQNS
jgi:hypothetical protein